MTNTANRTHQNWGAIRPSLLALTLVLCAGTAAAQAPDDATTEDEVVVTGFRASLANAINVKRNETAAVDAIVAEDIAAFPDLNLAESLQRIPGVAITRVAGEGRQISVRGLGPEYTRVRINGMEALATSGASGNGGGAGNNRGRGFDFNIFASELFNSLTVRKSAQAAVEEGSLGATVDLNTSRPFDFSGQTFVLSGQAGYNDFAESYDPRVAALWSNTFMDGAVGALFSVAYSSRDTLQELHGTTRWGPGGANGGFNAASTLPGYTLAQINNSTASGIFHPRNPSFNSYENTESRLGVTGSLQFRPTDVTEITINGLYGVLDGRRNERLLQGISFSRGGATGKPGTIIRDGEVDDDNNLIYGLFDNVDMRSQTSWHELSTTFTQVTAEMQHEFTDRFRVSALLGSAESDFDAPINTEITFENVDGDNYLLDYRQNDRVPYMQLGFDPSTPASWSTVPGVSALNIGTVRIINTFETAKFEGEFDFTPAFSVRAGVDWRAYDFSSVEAQRLSGELAIPVLTAAQVASLSTRVTDFGRGLGLRDGAVTSWIVPSVPDYAAAFDIYGNTGIFEIGVAQSGGRGNTNYVQEENLGAFVQADFETELGIPIRGDIGVRYLTTDQASTGYAAVGATIELVSAERSYDMWLPSMNLAFELTPDLLMRLNVAKTMARPSLGALSPGGDISVQGGNRSFSSGNPNLEPTQSNNLDMSLEWYPAEGSLYSVAVFYKDISTFAQTLRETRPYNTLGLPLELLNGTIALPTDDFDVTRPVNTDGGELMGFEVNVQQRFTFLPGFWSNFGALANYTYVDSDIEYLTSAAPGSPTVTSTLVGLSKDAWNGTLYYEDDRFSIRGSVAYRSGYLTQVPGRNSNFVEGTNETLNYDMQATYDVNDRLQVSFEGLNLTDEFDDRYVDDSNRVWMYAHTGRQFYVGLRYSY